MCHDVRDTLLSRFSAVADSAYVISDQIAIAITVHPDAVISDQIAIAITVHPDAFIAITAISGQIAIAITVHPDAFIAYRVRSFIINRAAAGSIPRNAVVRTETRTLAEVDDSLTRGVRAHQEHGPLYRAIPFVQTFGEQDRT